MMTLPLQNKVFEEGGGGGDCHGYCRQFWSRMAHLWRCSSRAFCSALRALERAALRAIPDRPSCGRALGASTFRDGFTQGGCNLAAAAGAAFPRPLRRNAAVRLLPPLDCTGLMDPSERISWEWAEPYIEDSAPEESGPGCPFETGRSLRNQASGCWSSLAKGDSSLAGECNSAREIAVLQQPLPLPQLKADCCTADGTARVQHLSQTGACAAAFFTIEASDRVIYINGETVRWMFNTNNFSISVASWCSPPYKVDRRGRSTALCTLTCSWPCFGLDST